MPLSVSVDLDDPLAGPSERFALGRPRSEPVVSDELPSPVGVRPFGLLFAAPAQQAGTPVPPWRFCPRRQVALTPDGAPWYRDIVDMTMRTTGASPDGGGSTGGEEYTPDFLADEMPDR
jgi:putative ATP-grasp target RiPP